MRTVVLRSGPKGFGFTLGGERPCRLSTVHPGGVAAQAGLQVSYFFFRYFTLLFTHLRSNALFGASVCVGNTRIQTKLPQDYDALTIFLLRRSSCNKSRDESCKLVEGHTPVCDGRGIVERRPTSCSSRVVEVRVFPTHTHSLVLLHSCD